MLHPPPGFPRVALRLMRTSIYLLVILAQVNQAALLAGLATFMAKFIERQFSQTVSLSSMMIGERPLPSPTFECVPQIGVRLDLNFQEEFVSHWRCWELSWEESWCEGWTFLSVAPASCARAPSWSACSLPCHWFWLAAPPRRSMGSSLLGNYPFTHTTQMRDVQTWPPTMNRSNLNPHSDVFGNGEECSPTEVSPTGFVVSALELRHAAPAVTVLRGHLTQCVAPTAWSSSLPATLAATPWSLMSTPKS